MSFKERAIRELEAMKMEEGGACGSVIGDCTEMFLRQRTDQGCQEKDDRDWKKECAKLQAECEKMQTELMRVHDENRKLRCELEDARDDIHTLERRNAWLEGFREGVVLALGTTGARGDKRNGC